MGEFIKAGGVVRVSPKCFRRLRNMLGDKAHARRRDRRVEKGTR